MSIDFGPIFFENILIAELCEEIVIWFVAVLKEVKSIHSFNKMGSHVIQLTQQWTSWEIFLVKTHWSGFMSARSTDLFSLHYLLWGYLTVCEFCTNPLTIQELEGNIIQLIAGFGRAMLRKVARIWKDLLVKMVAISNTYTKNYFYWYLNVFNNSNIYICIYSNKEY